MKHTFRQRVINEYGLPVTKVESVNAELGSGIFDKNGREIFEGDKVKFPYGKIVQITKSSLLNGYRSAELEIVEVVERVEDLL